MTDPQNGKGIRKQSFSTDHQQKRLSNATNDEKRKSDDLDQYGVPRCHFHRTRTSIDDLRYPLDDPSAPLHYNQPFRRNYRYFGYPKELNLHLNTPPRVKSWGPTLPQTTRIKPKRKPFKLTKDKKFDPNWIGRVVKSNLLLQNPGLIPVIEKDVHNLGDESVNWVRPDFQHTDCTSELYFPLSEKSRKGFCRINKNVQEIIDKDIHDYTVQNRTMVKTKRLEGEVRKSETEVGFKPLRHFGKKDDRKSNFSITDFGTHTAETMFYSRRAVPPIMKMFCIPEYYPGINVQPYARPIHDDDEEDHVMVKEDDTPITGVVRIPVVSSNNVPDDVWNQLSKVRVRRNLIEKQLNKNKKKSFKTFTQLEFRNHVMREARQDFVKKVRTDVYTPLPAELFQDNRNLPEPSHDYVYQGEYPPQGPFWWKEEREEGPTPAEIKIVDDFIEEQKRKHSFTHHLPGLLYAPRHPFQTLDLDWMEEGTEMQEITQARRTPVLLHDMPEYIMGLAPQKFQEKFETAVMEGAKDLVGPEMYELYLKKHGRVISPPVSEQVSLQEMSEVIVPQKKKVRKRLPKVISEAKDFDEEEEEEEEDGEEEEEEAVEEEIPEVEEYRLDDDLEEMALEEFPHPDIRFSLIEFPKTRIPSGLRDDLKFFKKQIERATPVPLETEEPAVVDDSSTTTTESDELEQAMPSSSHDAVSHLQVLYQEAVKEKYRGSHRHIHNQNELEPPPLKNIFLMDDYTEDIDHLLHRNDHVPKFLQLF